MKYDIFHVLNEVDDKYIIEAGQCIESKNKNLMYRWRYALGTAAAIVFVIVLNITNPVFARNIPFIGNVFEYLQTKLDFSGAYDKYSTDVEMTAKSNGITVIIKETYCDGENLFVSYQIESDKAFSDYTDENYLQTQLDFDGAIYVTDEGENLKIDDFGVAGLEGEFVDEYTFIGVDTIRLEEGEFPDEFTYGIQTYRWNLILNNGSEKAIKGYWDLSVTVTANREDVETIAVNATEQQHNIDKVVVSPIMVTIYTSYPEIYNDSVNYEVVVFSDKSEENINFQACYGNTEGKTWIPRNMVGDILDIYVVDYSTFTLKGAAAYAKEEIEKHAIVSTHINLTTNQE